MTEDRRRWIEALRSGEYTQTRGALKTDFGYCCLGVACNTIHPNGWEKAGGRYQFSYLGITASVYLPKPLRDKLNLSLIEEGKLSHMNDEGGASFQQIADYLESLPD